MASLTIRVVDDILLDYDRENSKENLEQGEGSARRKEAEERQRPFEGYVVISGNEGEEYAWPNFEDVHDISLGAVENHQGYRDPGLIEGAIGNTQMQQMYGQHQDVFETAAHLIAKLQRQQAIVEGNKRTATNVGMAFLENNGYDTSGCYNTTEKEDRLIWLVYNISDAVNAGGDEVIEQLAQFLRENCTPLKQGAIWEDAFKQGHGAAFWYDPKTGLHWGDTHYMIFHNEGLGEHNEQGIFGWVHPDSWGEEDPQHPDYDISFGTDFGFGANKANPQLQREAVEEVENDMGYPAYDIFWEKSAGHSYETDDLENDTADSLGYDFPSREIPCHNCEMPVYHGEICGYCGMENLGQTVTPLALGKVAAIMLGTGEAYSCFGFIPPVLYLGSRHHMMIMAQLLQHGWTWEQLASAQQIWGWVYDRYDGGPGGERKILLRFSTDAASHDPELIPQVKEAFAKLTGVAQVDDQGDPSASNSEYGPNFKGLYDEGGAYRDYYTEHSMPTVLAFNYLTGDTERWTDQRLGFWQDDKEFERLVKLDKQWSDGYTIQTKSSWEDQFDEDLDPDMQGDGGTSEDMANKPAYEIDGWKVYEMNSDEYPDHDALWIDRTNKIMIVNYQGHHAPMFEQFNSLMSHGPNSTAGHFRSSPSTTESFPAGWGWHGSPGTKEEKMILKQVLKKHYDVEKLKDLYQPNENAEEDYFEDEGDHEAKVKPKKQAKKDLWTDATNATGLTKEVIYDILNNKTSTTGV